MKGIIIICGLLFTLNAAAQEQVTTDSVSPQANSKSLMSKLHLVQQILDDKARGKVDPRYIEVPEKPWRVILRYKETAVDVDYENDFYFPEDKERFFWKLCFEPPVAASIGFWAGYRGTGISYSHSLVKNAGRYFSFSTTGAKYGFNFRHRRFSTYEVKFNAKDYQDEKLVEEQNIQDRIDAPVWIRSTYINGYYVFNGHHYSQAAAYNQSVIQRRSAGSLLVGATWYQSSFDLSAPENALFVILSKRVGRIKMHQANIGIGYGYNFVPFRGLVINAMAMPTLSIYNRVKVYKYDYNYLPMEENDIPLDNYGKWNSQTHTWANGEKYKPMDVDDKYLQDIEGWEIDNDINYGRLQFNVDLRLGIAYNWSNYFIGLQGQFNRFSYKVDETKVVLIDSYARVSLGVRF